MRLSTPPESEVHLRFRPSGELSFVSADGPVADLLGYSAEDLAHRRVSFFDRVHPGDSDIVATLIAETDGSRRRIACLRIRHADGRIRCIRAEASISGGGNDRRLALCLQTAQAARLRADALQAEPQLSILFENSGEAVFLKDTTHVYVAASMSFRRQIRKELHDSELIGKTDYDLLPEREADQFFEAEKRVLLGLQPRENITEIHSDGVTHWIYAHYFPLLDQKGQIAGVFANSRNITERLRTEERFNPDAHSGVNGRSSLTGTYILDTARGVFATSSALDVIFGIGKDYSHDLAGWEKLIHPEDRQKMLSYLENVLAVKGRIFNREYRIIRQNDGAIRWVQGIGRVDRDAQGNPMLLRGTVEDITDRKLTEAALRETRDRLQLFIEHAPAALAMFDRDMRYLAISRRWLELRRMGRDILGKRHYDIAPHIPEHWKEAHRRGLAGESVRCNEERYECPDGSVQWLRWEVLPWRTAEGGVGGIVLFLEDITEEKIAQERLRLAAHVFAHSTEAIAVMDPEGRILEVNDSFTRMTGFERNEVLGKIPYFLRSPKQSHDFYSEMWHTLLRSGHWRGETWAQAKDGRQFAAVATITTVYETEHRPQYLVALFADVTSAKEQAERLERSSRFDALTGLPNRALMAESLSSAMVEAGHSHSELAAIYVDVDNFKAVNDRFGRAASDELLVRMAHRLAANLHPGGILGRLGGDEFLVVLPGLTSQNTGIKRIERILRSVEKPFRTGDELVQVSVTAGVAFYTQSHDVDADQLVRQANQAMYEAKLAGKARMQIFDPVRASSVRGLHEELHRIRQGLQAGEFELRFQPKVNMATGEWVGAEALIRWQHPERGLLLPDAFLPATEKADAAVELGEWVFESALRQLEAWTEQGLRIPISVNVSADHLQQPDFMHRLEQLLLAHPKVDPALLELEILETSTLQDMPHVSSIIESCTRKRMSVAIDDFGTGYSSLTYLKRLPAQVLKIDQSFVRDMLEDPDDLAILQGILGLAAAFRRIPVAEGVESVEHGVLLLKMGCVCAQGYGIARPMSSAEIVAWSGTWKPDPRWRKTQQVSPLDWPLMVAEVETRAWTRNLTDFIQGRRLAPPELDPRRCRLGTWLETEKNGTRGTSDVFRRLYELHARSHAMADKAVYLYRRQRAPEAVEPLTGLAELRRQMEAELARLYRSLGQCA